MPQDDRKGQPPSTRGKSPVPSAPDIPDARDANAPPPPEAPETAPSAPETEPTPEPDDAMAGDGTVDAGEELEQQPEKNESQRLRGEIDAARTALEAMEAELARAEAKEEEDKAAAKMVSDYSAEVPALKASERELHRYRTAETSFLNEILPAAARTAIAEVHKKPEQDIAALLARIEEKERDAAEARMALGEARQDAAEAKDKAEALKRPAAAVRDRIKRADAVRVEATKAKDAGRYALAYSLVMPGGKLERAIAAEPAIIPPEELGGAIKAAAAAQKEADDRVAALTKEVETLEAALQKDRTGLAELQRGLDAKVLAELSKLNPQTAAAA
ncbi:MAG TPA: hypothetical protein VK472_08425 [Allosphingosinicella sp.]|nr:hypothetical protein [Allosphingosinicella sp.]